LRFLPEARILQVATTRERFLLLRGGGLLLSTLRLSTVRLSIIPASFSSQSPAALVFSTPLRSNSPCFRVPSGPIYQPQAWLAKESPVKSSAARPNPGFRLPSVATHAAAVSTKLLTVAWSEVVRRSLAPFWAPRPLRYASQAWMALWRVAIALAPVKPPPNSKAVPPLNLPATTFENPEELTNPCAPSGKTPARPRSPASPAAFQTSLVSTMKASFLL
jgi:hypothetical protein